jgi:FkbM family methyltransferase
MALPTYSFTFFDEKGERVEHLICEYTEQKQAYKYVPEDAQGVLELGARYGTVTCAISNKIKNRPVLISVEPDSNVWNALEDNLRRHSVNATVVKGAISRKPIGMVHFQYSSFTTIKPEEDVKPVAEDFKRTLSFTQEIATWTLEQILEMTKIPVIDVLVADCEGFLEQFLDENPSLYKTLRVIIFEKDAKDRCNYNKIQWYLHKNGLREVVDGFHAVWIRASNEDSV